MADDIKIEVLNAKEIEYVLKNIPNSLSFSFMNKTLADIARQTVLKDAKAGVPTGKKDTTGRTAHKAGNLKRSLGISTYPRKFGAGVLVGPKSRSILKRGIAADGWYAHMIEFGHWAGGAKRGKGGNKGTYVQPQPFMRSAWERNKTKIESMIGQSFGKVITKYIKRHTK